MWWWWREIALSSCEISYQKAKQCILPKKKVGKRNRKGRKNRKGNFLRLECLEPRCKRGAWEFVHPWNPITYTPAPTECRFSTVCRRPRRRFIWISTATITWTRKSLRRRQPGHVRPSEQANITECWRQVSIYYAMFNVNVTTDVTTLPKAWELISPTSAARAGRVT